MCHGKKRHGKTVTIILNGQAGNYGRTIKQIFSVIWRRRNREEEEKGHDLSQHHIIEQSTLALYHSCLSLIFLQLSFEIRWFQCAVGSMWNSLAWSKGMPWWVQSWWHHALIPGRPLQHWSHPGQVSLLCLPGPPRQERNHRIKSRPCPRGWGVAWMVIAGHTDLTTLIHIMAFPADKVIRLVCLVLISDLL